jgi:hypothetical protein
MIFTNLVLSHIAILTHDKSGCRLTITEVVCLCRKVCTAIRGIFVVACGGYLSLGSWTYTYVFRDLQNVFRYHGYLKSV